MLLAQDRLTIDPKVTGELSLINKAAYDSMCVLLYLVLLTGNWTQVPNIDFLHFWLVCKSWLSVYHWDLYLFRKFWQRIFQAKSVILKRRIQQCFILFHQPRKVIIILTSGRKFTTYPHIKISIILACNLILVSVATRILIN